MGARKISDCQREHIAPAMAFVAILILMSTHPATGFAPDHMPTKNSGYIITHDANTIEVTLDGAPYYLKSFGDETILKVLRNRSYPLIAVFTSSENERSPDLPLTYSVSTLFIVDLEKKLALKYSPSGDLNFSDWYFEIWPEGGKYTLLQQDRFGPFHLVRTENLTEYLQGRRPADRVIQHSGKIATEAMVHHFAGWISDKEFKYTASCCGTVFTSVYDCDTGKEQSHPARK